MDVSPPTPPPTGVGGDGLVTDAYEQFWDCLEGDAPVEELTLPSPDVPADAYVQFWQRADA